MTASPNNTALVPPTLLHVFPTFKVGGAQMRLSQIANGLAKDYRHIIIALDGAYEAAALMASDVYFECVDELPDIKSASLISRLVAYRRILKALKPDLLLTYNWGAIEWALANLRPLCPHIHCEDGFGPEEAHRQIPRRVWTRRLALTAHTHIMVPSQTLNRLALEHWRLPAKRLTYIPNGIDCDRFKQQPDSELIKSLGLPTECPLVGTVTALRAEKNLPRLLHAFAQTIKTSPAHLIIIGEGQERASLENLAHSLHLASHVTFAGHMGAPEKILGALDIFAISSDTEQMPLSVLEAMAAGLPIAGVDVGDIKVMVAPENQPYITESDTDQFANALHELTSNEPLRMHLGQANEVCVNEKYAEETMIERYDSLFKGIINP